MSGNVWQWTSSDDESASSAQVGTGGSAAAARFIVKGGSWMDGPNELRVSNRRGLDPAKGYADVGFRLVMEVEHD